MEVKDNELFFAKVNPNAIIPTKNNEDAGYDIYACFEEDFMIIKPFETKIIPTGIASAMTDEYYIQIQERGSTGSKAMKYGAGVIDSGFRDEWKIILTNVNLVPIIISKLSVEELASLHPCSTDEFIYYPYSKAIAQGVVHYVPKMKPSEISYQELLTIPSKRGLGMLGSSNK